MTLERLDNLVKTGQVHEEAADQGEFERLVSMARRRLADSQVRAVYEVEIMPARHLYHG